MATEMLITIDHVHMQALSNCIFITTLLLASLIAKPLYELAILTAIYDMGLLFSQQQTKSLTFLSSEKFWEVHGGFLPMT